MLNIFKSKLSGSDILKICKKYIIKGLLFFLKAKNRLTAKFIIK